MMLPILISVSVTPGPKFFCAAALEAARAAPIRMPVARLRRLILLNCMYVILHHQSCDSRSRPLDARQNGANQPGGAGWHEIDQQDQDHAIDWDGQALRHAFRDDRTDDKQDRCEVCHWRPD